MHNEKLAPTLPVTLCKVILFDCHRTCVVWGMNAQLILQSFAFSAMVDVRGLVGREGMGPGAFSTPLDSFCMGGAMSSPVPWEVSSPADLRMRLLRPRSIDWNQQSLILLLFCGEY